MNYMKSLEAEHGVIGAMLIQPHLIDVLSDDLSPDAFFYAENRELYSLILSLHADDKPVDVITLSEAQPQLKTGHVTLALAGEIQLNTPSAANAKAYAKIVRDRAVARQIARIGAQISEIANENNDIEDRVSQAQALALSLDASGSDGECQMVGDILLEHSYELERRFQRTQDGVKVDGLSTGIADLDQKLGGLKAGQMIVLAGRPAMGKTTLAMNIATDAAIKQEKKVLVISLEMSKAQLMDRLIAAVGGIPLPAVKDGTVTSEYGEQMNIAAWKLKSAAIAVSDVPVMTMSRIRSIARRQKHRMGGMDLVVVDYLGLVEGDGNGRVEDVTAMSRQIKLLARELGCPVLILSQLNRGCESRPDKRPVLSDLRESGAIEQDADIAIFVYRDEVYYPNAAGNKGIAEVLIRKNRDGEIGVVRTLFQGDKSRFVPIAPEHYRQHVVEAGF